MGLLLIGELDIFLLSELVLNGDYYDILGNAADDFFLAPELTKYGSFPMSSG